MDSDYKMMESTKSIPKKGLKPINTNISNKMKEKLIGSEVLYPEKYVQKKKITLNYQYGIEGMVVNLENQELKNLYKKDKVIRNSFIYAWKKKLKEMNMKKFKKEEDNFACLKARKVEF